MSLKVAGINQYNYVSQNYNVNKNMQNIPSFKAKSVIPFTENKPIIKRPAFMDHLFELCKKRDYVKAVRENPEFKTLTKVAERIFAVKPNIDVDVFPYETNKSIGVGDKNVNVHYYFNLSHDMKNDSENYLEMLSTSKAPNYIRSGKIKIEDDEYIIKPYSHDIAEIWNGENGIKYNLSANCVNEYMTKFHANNMDSVRRISTSSPNTVIFENDKYKEQSTGKYSAIIGKQPDWQGCTKFFVHDFVKLQKMIDECKSYISDIEVILSHNISCIHELEHSNLGEFYNAEIINDTKDYAIFFKPLYSTYPKVLVSYNNKSNTHSFRIEKQEPSITKPTTIIPETNEVITRKYNDEFRFNPENGAVFGEMPKIKNK